MKSKKLSKKKFMHRVETTVKIVISLAIFFMAAIVILFIVGAIIGEPYVDIFEKYLYGCLAAACICSIIYLLIVFIVPAVAEQRFETAKLLSFKLNLPENKENAMEQVKKEIHANGYSYAERLWNNGSSYLDIFTKEDQLRLDCVAILRTEVFSTKVQDAADEAFGTFLNQDFRLYKVIRLTAIACTDNVNRPLRSFVRDNNDQKPEAFKFSSAIVLNTNEALIADIKKTFAYIQYKKLRAQFMQLIQPIRLED